MSAHTQSPVLVSLPSHLYSTLLPLVPILPSSLSSKLDSILSEREYIERRSASLEQLPQDDTEDAANAQHTIPYSLLQSISAWTRSADGSEALTRAGLVPSSYGIVSLLAGTQTQMRGPPPITSSSVTFSTTAEVGLGKEDRRAIVALMNALLSIVGSGVAGWWAAGGLRWQDEWVSPIASRSAFDSDLG